MAMSIVLTSIYSNALPHKMIKNSQIIAEHPREDLLCTIFTIEYYIGKLY